MSIQTDGPTTLLRSNDEQAIRKLTEDWLAAVHTKDIPRLIAMVTDDAVFLPPGLSPIRGKQAVEAMYQTFFPQFSSIEQDVSIEEIQIADDWAFSWGTEKFVLVPKAGGPPIEMQGKGMTILRKQPDASWKFARGINNTLPKSAAQTR
jgi:uncharacterized protein (TIGR02246 family)